LLILMVVAIASTVSATVAAAAMPSLAAVPTSIDAGGTADVTGALNSYFAGVPDGSTIVFPANGRYRIEGTLSLENRRDIVIDGRGSTFFAKTNGLNRRAPGCDLRSSVCRYPNRTRAHWSFSNATNIVVRNVNVIGSAPNAGPNSTYSAALEAQHAFRIVGVDGIMLDHVSARDVWGDLVYVGSFYARPRFISSTNVVVRNSTFRGASRQGWTVTDGTHVTFSNNSLSSARRSLIDLEANTSKDVIAYVTIRNNRLGASRFCTITNHGAAAVEHDIVIADNRVLGAAKFRICVQAFRTARRSNYEISGNVGSAARPNEPMLSIAYVDNVTVKGNVQAFSAAAWPWRAGISPEAPVTAKCASVVVSANRFTRAAGMPELAGKRC
jgi:hypothetical protein